MDEILKAKIHLYKLLLKKSDDDLSSTEIDLLYHLVKDEEIQNYIQEKIEK